MILQALNSYYERTQADPEKEKTPFGYSWQKISFCIVIEQDGTLVEIHDERRANGKKLIPISRIVCGGAKPSGSGINPCFLWDNPAYMLGYKSDDEKPARTLESFNSFRKKHCEAESQINQPDFSAVCRFLEKWDPKTGSVNPKLVEIGTGFGCFRIRGHQEFVHENDSVREWWNSQQSSEDESTAAETQQCLVTGGNGPIARLHEPKVKGVIGAQSSGAAIVSFNLDAFESYGKVQSLNAPVSEQAAFQYCTAINALLSDENRRFVVGDTTIVFWTTAPSPAEDLLGFVFDSKKSEDDVEINRLSKVLATIVKGGYPSEFGDPATPFYVLGLSPNAARISVRFWWKSTLGEFVANLHQHHCDMALVKGPKDPDVIYPWQIIRETARESKDIPPLLAGALMRSILSGQSYPSMLLSALVRRIRADGQLRYFRIAAIKACLNRDLRSQVRPDSKELPMSLDAERVDPAYRLGRLFAELEKVQEEALPGINDTIKDRYFGAASATPGSVFPRLVRMSQHHLGKLEIRAKIYHEKRIQQIYDSLSAFPAHLGLKDQGLFAIGYYHQRQDCFQKKSKSDGTPTVEE